MKHYCVFRMTGGEPLMDKNTFRVLDYVANNPKGDLEIGITTNNVSSYPGSVRQICC